MKRQHIIFAIITLMACLWGNSTKAQKTWDFTAKMSSTDITNIETDISSGGNWYYDSGKQRYSYTAALSNSSLTANGTELSITSGLHFSCSATTTANTEGNIRIEDGKRMWLASATSPIIIPDMKKGQTLKIVYQSSSKDNARGITTTNVSGGTGFDASTSQQTGEGQATDDGDVTLAPTGGIYVFSIEIGKAPNPEETIVTPATEGATKSDVTAGAVNRNMNARQMQLMLSDGDIKYYNTDDIMQVSSNDSDASINVTMNNQSTDHYYGTVSDISFSKALPSGKEADIENNGVVITTAKGWLESAYVEWKPLEGATSYVVYVKGGQYSEYTKLDDQLVRKYPNKGRADAVGLKKGTNYAFKVVPVIDGSPDESKASTASNMEVENYNRDGYAHSNYSGVGAYNDDGTLKADARVIYVTKNTAKTVSLPVFTNNKGKEETFTGLQDIFTAYQKGYETRPLAVRIIGTVKRADLDRIDSSEEGLQIKGKNAYSELNITIEGIGDDATTHGFGFLIRNAKSLELRNFASMWSMDDAISLDTENSNVWVHHLDLFYGQPGSDADQKKGDGTIDVKAHSRYITIAYNHLFDSGKAELCGMKSETTDDVVTYHHNWYDHSDSRHPRVRTMTVHVYNNYFDGVSKYGVGATMGSSVFVENNYFRGTKRPMMSSKQGTDAQGDGTFSGENGGMIKSFGNVFVERGTKFQYATQNNPLSTGYDAYETSTRDEQVPSSEKTKEGGTTYNNFDTASSMYSYSVDEASDVPANVMGFFGAGRLNHGDFSWDFTGTDDDYDVDQNLSQAIQNYTSSLIGIYGDENADSGEQGGGGDQPGGGDEPGGSDEPDGSTISADVECNFQNQAPSNSLFTVTNGNYSNSKGEVTVNGVKYTICLKMEKATEVSFTTEQEMTMTLALTGNINIKIDDTKVTGDDATGMLTTTLPAGQHKLTKADSSNLFYIGLKKN